VAQSGEWQLRVNGHPDDLEYLAAELKAEVTRIAPDQFEGNAYVLLSTDFAVCADHNEVVESGSEHLKRLSGLLRCMHGSMTPLEAGAVYRVRPDAARDVFTRLVGGELRIRFGLLAAIALDANGNPLPVPPSATQVLARLMTTDAAVAKVMRLSGAPDSESWVGLARIREVIETDVSGSAAIQKAGWASGNELERFKHSANCVSVAGDAARHGHERTHRPSKPMTLSGRKSTSRELGESG